MKAVNLLEKTNQLWKLYPTFAIGFIAIFVVDFATAIFGL